MANRFENKVRILGLLRERGQASRPLLSEALSINLPTISNLTKELNNEKLIRGDGFDKSGGGRRAERLALNPAFATAIGLELSLTGVRGVLADLGGRILDREEGPERVPEAPKEMADAVLAVAEGLLARSLRERRPVGVGLGVAGLTGGGGRVSRHFPHRKQWKDVSLAERLEKRLGVPARLDNDVQAATLAEQCHGVAHGERNVLYLHIGHGIACGIVADGRLYTGATRNAGEFGHTIVERGGPVCYCGNYGCLESLASPSAIVEQVRQAVHKGAQSSLAEFAGQGQSRGRGRGRGREDKTLRPEAVFQAADEGDRLAANVVARAAEYIGLGLANLVNCFNPGRVVFGGAILVRGYRVLNEGILRTFRQRVLPILQTETSVECSSLGRDAVALGGAVLVFDELFARPERLFAIAHGHRPAPESGKKNGARGPSGASPRERARRPAQNTRKKRGARKRNRKLRVGGRSAPSGT